MDWQVLKWLVLMAASLVVAIFGLVGVLGSGDVANAADPHWYETETYKLIDSMMNDYEGIREFHIDGEGHSCIVTLVDAEFREYRCQRPRPAWHKCVREVIEQWQEAQQR